MAVPGRQVRRVRIPVPLSFVVLPLLQVAFPLYMLTERHRPAVERTFLVFFTLMIIAYASSVATGTWLTPLGIRPATWLFKRLNWSRVRFITLTGQRPNQGAVSVIVTGRRRPVQLAGTKITDLNVIRQYAADYRPTSDAP